MNDMRQMTSLGRAIEDESFAIIDSEIQNHGYSPIEWEVVRRVIHASADFEFAELMAFSSDCCTLASQAIRAARFVVTDVEMIVAGLSRERLLAFGLETRCAISEAEVIATAKREQSTRAIVAMRTLARRGQLGGSIVAIGNAPTALLEILKLARDPAHRPALVVGVPVGFVSAAESKAALGESDLNYILSRGRKGGSTIAVSILHALFRVAAEQG